MENKLSDSPLTSYKGLSLTIAHPIPVDDPFFVEACRTVIFGLDTYNKQITGIIPKRQLFYTDNEGSAKLIADIRQYSLEFDNSNVDTLESILESDPEFLLVLQAKSYEYGARRAFSWCYRDTPLFDSFINAGFIPTGEFPDLMEGAIVQRFYKDLEPYSSSLYNPTCPKISISEECDADYTEEHVDHLLGNPESFGIFIHDRKGKSIKGGIMGTVYMAEKKGTPCGYINFLWVDGSLRGANSQKKGLGKLLMKEAEKLFKEQGVQYAQATTNGFQAPGFYEKLGFVMVKSCPGHLLLKDGSLDDVFECTKKLSEFL